MNFGANGTQVYEKKADERMSHENKSAIEGE